MIICSNKKRAATLIEIIIAVLIIGCAFIPILRLVDYGSVSTSKIGHYAKATRLAQELIEECKHVPFKVYQEQYGLLDETKIELVNPAYFKETEENIKKFKEESKDTLKEFEYTASLETKKNDLKQISEVWFYVEMSWYDKGKQGEKRSIKVGNAYYNSEAL